MFKKRYYKAGYNFKTGFYCKFFLFLGFLLLLFFIILSVFSLIFNEESTGFASGIYSISTSTIPESILSFSLIFIAIGLILYFFDRQFAKLAKIADEIENGEKIEKNN